MTLPPTAFDLVASGQTLEAIKAVRSHTGLGLREAKTLVERIERGELRPGDDLVPGTAGVTLAPRIAALVAGGRKIEAIKTVRDATGAGLREAKDLVESVERGLDPSIEAPLAPGAGVRGGWIAWIVALGVALLIAILLTA